MLDNLVFSFNAIMPIFIIICLGYILKQKGITNDIFLNTTNKVMFNIALPCLLFADVYKSDFKRVFDPKLMTYAVSATILCFFVILLFVKLFIKDKTKHGAFIQGAFRGNFAILGVPIVSNVFGDEGVSTAAVVLAVIVLIYNIFSVAVLLACSQCKDAEGGSRIKNTLIGMAKNPLIISIVLGIIFSLSGIKLPFIVTKPVEYLGNATVAMSLIVIGGSFNIKKALEVLKLSLLSSVIKTFITPLIFVPIAVLMGFRGINLGVLGILFSTPAAVNSYIMAKELGNDGDLAASIVVISTALSVVSIFLVIYILKSLNLLGI